LWIKLAEISMRETGIFAAPRGSKKWGQKDSDGDFDQKAHTLHAVLPEVESCRDLRIISYGRSN
jgi:hypothetical protein